MKILFVHGDDDYAALTYEQDIGKEKALDAMNEVYDKDVEIGEGIYGRLMDVGAQHAWDALDEVLQAITEKK